MNFLSVFGLANIFLDSIYYSFLLKSVINGRFVNSKHLKKTQPTGVHIVIAVKQNSNNLNPPIKTLTNYRKRGHANLKDMIE